VLKWITFKRCDFRHSSKSYFHVHKLNYLIKKPLRVSLPFKDQTSDNAFRRQMPDLSHKIDTVIQQDLKPKEIQALNQK